MSAYGTVTTGTAASVQTRTKAGGANVEIVQDTVVTSTPSVVSWAATSAGSANVLAATPDRVALLIVNRANSELWIRFDATIPVAGVAHSWFLAMNERWEVPSDWAPLAVSLACAGDGGTVYLTPGLDA